MHSPLVSGEEELAMPPTPKNALKTETPIANHMPQRLKLKIPNAATKPSTPNTTLPYTTTGGPGLLSLTGRKTATQNKNLVRMRGVMAMVSTAGSAAFIGLRSLVAKCY